MAVVVGAYRVAQRGQDGPGAGAGLIFGQPGAPGHLPDEVGDVDRVGSVPALPRGPQLLGQRFGQIQGEAPGLAFAQLAGESLQHGPGDIRRLLTRQHAPLRHRADEHLLVHGHGPLHPLTS